MSMKMGAAAFTDKVRFYRLNQTTDEFGGVTSGFESSPFLERRCQFRPANARERMEAGRPEASVIGVIRLRRSKAVMEVTAADKAEINGVDYQIRSDPITLGGRDLFIEFDVERGVAI